MDLNVNKPTTTSTSGLVAGSFVNGDIAKVGDLDTVNQLLSLLHLATGLQLAAADIHVAEDKLAFFDDAQQHDLLADGAVKDARDMPNPVSDIKPVEATKLLTSGLRAAIEHAGYTVATFGPDPKEFNTSYHGFHAVMAKDGNGYSMTVLATEANYALL